MAVEMAKLSLWLITLGSRPALQLPRSRVQVRRFLLGLTSLQATRKLQPAPGGRQTDPLLPRTFGGTSTRRRKSARRWKPCPPIPQSKSRPKRVCTRRLKRRAKLNAAGRRAGSGGTQGLKGKAVRTERGSRGRAHDGLLAQGRNRISRLRREHLRTPAPFIGRWRSRRSWNGADSMRLLVTRLSSVAEKSVPFSGRVPSILVHVLGMPTPFKCGFMRLLLSEGLCASRHDGTFGLIATNTIAEGDTKEVGLDQITASDGCHNYSCSIPLIQWPGMASQEISSPLVLSIDRWEWNYLILMDRMNRWVRPSRNIGRIVGIAFSFGQ